MNALERQIANYETAADDYTPNWETLNKLDDHQIHHVFTAALDHAGLCASSRHLRYLVGELHASNFVVDLAAKTIKTEAGRTLSLTKFLSRNPAHLDDILTHLDSPEAKIAEIGKLLTQKKKFVISSHPAYILGAAVGKHGGNLQNSCHHPRGINDTQQYKTGPASYLATRQALTFGILDDENNLIGRQIAFLDSGAPLEFKGLLTGRNYGTFTDADAQICRAELYRLVTPGQTWKKSTAFTVHSNRFYGYEDSKHYKAYRLNKTRPISIHLAAPVCIECGETHNGRSNGLSCCSPEEEEDAYCTCEGCGERVPEDEVHNYNDRYYCRDCFYESYRYCSCCGESEEKEKVHPTANGDIICEYCAEKKGYELCYDCDTYTQDYIYYDDRCYCDDCIPEGAERCEYCGDYFDRDDMTFCKDENAYYCDTHAARYLEECEHCGKYFSSTVISTNNTDEKNLCDDCNEELYPGQCANCGTRTPLEAQGSCDQYCAAVHFYSEEV